MKILLTFFCFLFVTFSATAQNNSDYAEIDRIALNIPESQCNSTGDIAKYVDTHFKTDTKKVRAIYVWVISHLNYSKDSLHRIILNENKDELVSITMRRRKGVCENFAVVFNDICRKSNLRSFVVDGYTMQAGSVNKSSHAWCAVFIDNNWALYDPTWDASSVKGFSDLADTHYFQVSPAFFIQTHMPFDPMFQLLDYPFTYKEFNAGYTQSRNNKNYFNYVDSINRYELLDPFSAYSSAASRIKNNGPLNDMINTKLSQLKMEIEIINQDKDSVFYNGAIADYNAAVSIFNNFLNYRNNQFKPVKTGENLESMFNNITKLVASARIKLVEVNNSKATLTLNTGDIQFALDNLSAHVKEQRTFLKNYLATAKQN
jgi:hypothetical protein